MWFLQCFDNWFFLEFGDLFNGLPLCHGLSPGFLLVSVFHKGLLSKVKRLWRQSFPDLSVIPKTWYKSFFLLKLVFFHSVRLFLLLCIWVFHLIHRLLSVDLLKFRDVVLAFLSKRPLAFLFRWILSFVTAVLYFYHRPSCSWGELLGHQCARKLLGNKKVGRSGGGMKRALFLLIQGMRSDSLMEPKIGVHLEVHFRIL